jgi:molecular chaperone DnaK
VIKASSGLSDEEVEQMVKDAEAHADDDKKFQEMVGVRNQADNLIHATKKSMDELGDKVEEAEKTAIEAAIKDLEEALKGDDKDDIEAKTKALSEASASMAQKLYAEQGGAEGAAPGADMGAEAGAQDAGAKADDDVVDAEFEEVDDKKSNN